MNDESPWNRADTVRGFAQSPPNETLLRFAASVAREGGRLRALDIGCGAARNAAPLAQAGWHVWGVDTSFPMLTAAVERMKHVVGTPLRLVQAAMTNLPFASDRFELVIAHGVWNLATSDDMFRQSVREAARVTRADGVLFVFTFSRHTLPAEARPLDGERYTFTQFSGRPQLFLRAEELIDELDTAGFSPEPAVPLTEHNRQQRTLMTANVPVIYEGAFRRRA